MDYCDITPAHLDALAQMFAETFNTPPWNGKWTAETAARRLHQIMYSESFYGLAAYTGGGLCGMILGRAEQNYDGVTFEIKELCIKNELRKNGIGTALLSEAESRLKAKGITDIILVTLRGNATEGFYKTRGFTVSENMILMNKKLP